VEYRVLGHSGSAVRRITTKDLEDGTVAAALKVWATSQIMSARVFYAAETYGSST
jgi:hypothetical protein